jgi:alpha-glucosidase
MTISLDAPHYGVKDNEFLVEFNTHALFGYMEAELTANYFRDKLEQRPFVISRSSFPTHGKNAGHWLGDNYSTWQFMNFSIPGVFNFQMFGVPIIGADICGFKDNTTEELCSRWM